jgi:hypothetical protein
MPTDEQLKDGKLKIVRDDLENEEEIVDPK